MYCKNCGTQLADNVQFCKNCGAKRELFVPAPSGHGAQYPPPASPHGYAPPPPGGYIQNLHSFGSSTLFLIGVILFTGAGFISLLVNFSLTGIFNLAMFALPAIALWLIYVASKQPRLPEKVFTSLTLYKVYAIIILVVFCMILGSVAIVWIIGMIAGVGFGAGGAVVVVFITGAIVIGIMVLFLVFYFVAALRIINGVRHGLATNTFAPLRGVTPFIVISWILVGFGVIGGFSAIAGAGFVDTIPEYTLNILLREFMWDIPHELYWVIDIVDEALISATPSAGAMAFAGLLSLVSAAGQGILLVVLGQFSNSVKMR
ncbi:MAG: zinc ribbon domain-containing protein [Defluviitaleaceae bacterium]|nr:zinc ribbon domain-containing protein [Defluviitaleaceae bacterium]